MQECKSGSSDSERCRSALTGLCTCVMFYRQQHVSLCGGGGGGARGSLMMFPALLPRRWVSPRDAFSGTALRAVGGRGACQEMSRAR